MKLKKLLFILFSSILYSSFTFIQSANLHSQEVEILKQIGEKLGLDRNKGWDFDKDPCTGEGKWGASVLCDCSFDRNTTCRVTQIYITSENVSAALPSEFAKLQNLKHLDLNRNYFHGTIPSEWATMRLNFLILMGNRLSGPFPTTLTRMTTLQVLNIDGNHFSGPIPKEIANLRNLEKLSLSSNDFSGRLPIALAKLSNLTDLRIQGCSFEGPIPSSISVLTQLNDLRISDLKGAASSFPPLEKMTQLNILVLRNCLIHGTIPKYVGNMRSLTTLDLSFNNLTGNIPSSFSLLGNAEYIYLTKNYLTGPLPGWILSSTKNVDVSYNHFTWDASSGPKRCEQGAINVVESYSSSTHNQKNIHPCLRKDFPCTKPNAQKIRSLHINCGGEEVKINNTVKYEADTERRGASSYYNNGNWAFSSTGDFVYDARFPNVHILSNTSNLNNISTVDTALYTKARTAAISLTYYGLCLMNGMYTVKLHFAEIIFTQNKSFNSLGKRVFDVYVQGELKLKDFDIVKDAGGTGRAVIKSYRVHVKNNTLKIQLYWDGKGTTDIPFIGNYGPIISAISVDPAK